MRVGFSGIILFFAVAASAAPNLRILTFPTHSRITFQVDESIQKEWRETKEGFSVLFKGFTPEDLGIVEGLRIQDSRASVIVRRQEGSTVLEGTWRFPSGGKAPANPIYETFRFQDRNPARFVLDFWLKIGPTVTQAKVKKENTHRKDLIARANQRSALREKIELERKKRREVGSDLAQYCANPISDLSEVFLKFDPIHVDFPRDAYLASNRPDRDYDFLSLKNVEDDERESIQVALSFYQKNKPGLSIKTIEWHEKAFPKSHYRIEMKFLLASAYWRLGYKPQSTKILEEISRNSPDTAPALYSMMFLATQAEEREDHLTAYEIYQKLLRIHGTHKNAWVFHMGASDALFKLQQTERGIQELRAIEGSTVATPIRAEAAYRIGDFLMQRGQYAQALAAYFQAISKYPEFELKFPSALANRGEALYWLGEPDRAIEAYTKFLEKFPGHPGGWRAIYRLAETRAQKPGSSLMDPQVRKAFQDTINRFPSSPGAILARIRLLPCGDHGGLDSEGAQRFFLTEADGFDGKGEVKMKSYPDLLSLAKIRTLVSFSEREEALSAISKFEEVKSPGVGKEILNRYFPKLFRLTIEGMLAEDRVVDAIDIFQKHSELFKKNLDSMDMDFLLKLANRASERRLSGIAQNITTFYRETSKYGMERGIASHEEEMLKLDRKLERSEELFIEARALWQKKGKEAASEIEAKLENIADESPHSAEKEILLGLCAESNKKWDEAVKHAFRAKSLLPSDLSSVASRITFWTAKLQISSGNLAGALSLLKHIENETPSEKDATDLGLPRWEGLRELRLLQAEIHEKASRWKDAAKVYEDLMKKEIKDNRVVYGLAVSLEKSGGNTNRKRAKLLFQEIANGKENDFWKQLATERLVGNGNQGG